MDEIEKRIKQNKVVRNVIVGICICASFLFAFKGSLVTFPFAILSLYLENKYR